MSLVDPMPLAVSLQRRNEKHLGRRGQSPIRIGKRPRAFGQRPLFKPLQRTECAFMQRSDSGT